MSLNLNLPQTNFAHLREYDDQLLRLGMLAEKYFTEDPNTCLLKLRQFAELLAQMLASRVGLYTSAEESQYSLLQRLQDEGILPRDVAQLFGKIRRSGNAANHSLVDDRRTAQDEQLFWEQMAIETEQAKARVEQQLAEQQASAISQPKSILTHYFKAANRAAESV
jgi:hypothetical protein